MLLSCSTDLQFLVKPKDQTHQSCDCVHLLVSGWFTQNTFCSDRLVQSKTCFLPIVCCDRPFAEKYAADEEAFFADYAQAHAKLSELGVEWVEDAPVTI